MNESFFFKLKGVTGSLKVNCAIVFSASSFSIEHKLLHQQLWNQSFYHWMQEWSSNIVRQPMSIVAMVIGVSSL